MGRDIAASEEESHEAARAACEVVELLESLWEQVRGDVSTAPVSVSQLRVLYALERAEGISLRILGEVVGATPPSVSRLCDRLQALGFIERETSPSSRRELQLWLTATGRRYLEDLRSRREAALSSTIGNMTPSARTALTQGLAAFQAAAGAAGPATQRPARRDRDSWSA
ncbi:MarR family winged helix-turn-helix transcriptional regulator [Streptomyces sp. CA-132043]|uniref:MarR family winged helix-turn-helix transcriptional regulator n=1 Tax=Streptomyces sp. CA-132043 TaxID=3240048 RepID=UPI003D938B65